MKDNEERSLHIFSDTRQIVMTVRSIRREGNRLSITGRILGAWESKMFINVEELPTLIRLMMNFSFFSYLLLWPILYFNHRRKRMKNEP